MALAERAAEDGEILAEDEHQPAVDRPRSGDDAVAREMLLGHAEVGAIMLDEHVELLEAVLVEQDVEPLARGQPALGVLRGDPLLASPRSGRGSAAFQLGHGG